MPQPISLPDGGLEFGAHALALRPELAVGIAAVAAEWTALENRMATAFAVGLGPHEALGLELYHTLLDRKLRDAMFLTVARARLEKDEIAELDRIQSDIRKEARRRNDVVHGSWAASPHYPEALLLVDWSIVSRRLFAGVNGAPEAPAERPVLYTTPDFRAILHRISLLQDRTDAFGRKLMYRNLRIQIEGTRNPGAAERGSDSTFPEDSDAGAASS